MANLSTRIEMPIEPQLDGRLKLLKRLFNFTLLMFRHDGTKNQVSKPRLLIALFFTIVCELKKPFRSNFLDKYQAVYILYYAIAKNAKFLSIILTNLTWELQCITSVVSYFLNLDNIVYFSIVLSIGNSAIFRPCLISKHGRHLVKNSSNQQIYIFANGKSTLFLLFLFYFFLL
jgi:hypothetical protein